MHRSIARRMPDMIHQEIHSVASPTGPSVADFEARVPTDVRSFCHPSSKRIDHQITK
jgi:hypothetical protein